MPCHSIPPTSLMGNDCYIPPFRIKTSEGWIHTLEVTLRKTENVARWAAVVTIKPRELRSLYPLTFRRVVARLIWENLRFKSETKRKKLLPSTARVVGKVNGLNLLPSEIRQSRYWRQTEKIYLPVKENDIAEKGDIWTINGQQFEVFKFQHFEYRSPFFSEKTINVGLMEVLP